LTYLGAAGVLLAIGVAASARPAWRAAAGDPLRALRME
jgi:ABC-type lipoprotein release transport system permease subunit